MSSINARLTKIERLNRAEDENEFAHLSDIDLKRKLRELYLEGVAHPDFSRDIKDTARDGLAELEAEVWKRINFLRRPDIAAAIESNRRAGLLPEGCQSYDTDCETLAREWGLLDANGTLISRSDLDARASAPPQHGEVAPELLRRIDALRGAAR
jgi:hypothetical protein